MTPQFRLLARALVAGLLSFLTQLQASQAWDASLLRSAVVGAVLAGAEYLTPINARVGLGKR